MTPAQLDEFLQRLLLAVLSTQRPDGTLHSTPVRFEYEHGTFFFWVGAKSVKGRNLMRNSEVSACIATQSEPYPYVSASGACEIEHGDIRERCLSICRRYYSEARARAFVAEDLSPGDSRLVLLKPSRLFSEYAA